MADRAHVARLKKLYACSDAIAYAAKYKTLQAAWDACDRGDWMLWLLGKHAGKPESKARRKLVFCAAQCARLARPHTKDSRVLKCIEVCEAWAKGEATIEALKEARSAAAYAAAAYATYAAAAAYATCAAATTCAAAAAAAYATCAAADPDAKKETLERCADIVRQYYPKVPTERGKK